jgi:hypothetical protein
LQKKFRMTDLGIEGHSAVLAYNDNFYMLYLHTADAKDVSAQMEAKFIEPVSYTPVSLEKGRSLNYTIMLRTWATYGGPAEVDLTAATMADSGLQVRVEPDHLVIPERSEAKAKFVISNSDDRPGTYVIRVTGRINNSSLLDGPCDFGGQCPVIRTDHSGWGIRGYGTGQGIGMGGQRPPESLQAKVVTNKQAYSPGEDITIEAYLVNDAMRNGQRAGQNNGA